MTGAEILAQVRRVVGDYHIWEMDEDGDATDAHIEDCTACRLEAALDGCVLLTREEAKRFGISLAVAYDELLSYVEVVGAEGALDDEEMPTAKLTDTIAGLAELLALLTPEQPK